MAWFPRRERRNALRNAAVDCARRGWFVVPGTYIVGDARARGRHTRQRREDRPLRCSCRLTICPAPGEHPAAPDWQVQATNEPHAVSWWWSGRDAPNLVLPTGWSFDVLHIPAALGTRLLGRFQDPYLEISPGPVIRGSSDWWFLVAPALEDDGPWLERLAAMGVRHRGVGSFVLAPPSTGGAAGGVYWVVPPSAKTVRLPTVAQFYALTRSVSTRYAADQPDQYELRGSRERQPYPPEPGPPPRPASPPVPPQAAAPNAPPPRAAPPSGPAPEPRPEPQPGPPPQPVPDPRYGEGTVSDQFPWVDPGETELPWDTSGDRRHGWD